MIKKISIRNFHSIGETQELLFGISSKDMLDDSSRAIANTKEGLNLVSCLIGHNASGKTNILKAITFLFWLINHSYTTAKSENKIPYKPHQLLSKKSSQISIEFFDKEVFYEYFIEFNEDEILKERLRKKVIRMALVFELKRNHKKVEIFASSLKINKSDEIRFKERRNVALLSGLIDTGYLPEMTCFKHFESNVDQRGRVSDGLVMPILLQNVSREMSENKSLLEGMISFFKVIDLGITDLRFNTVNSSPMLECVHESENGVRFALPIFHESNGTQHSLILMSKIKSILDKGGVFVVDEIETGLHPDLVKKLISLFENKLTNPREAQLIFSTHQHSLINDRTKTQIFIVEKTEGTHETEVYRLDNVEGIRNDENYFQKYIAGTYGGTPRFRWM